MRWEALQQDVALGDRGPWYIFEPTRAKAVAIVEKEAHARLIAAAPEMLAELRNVQRAFKYRTDNGAVYLGDGLRERITALVKRVEGT